MKSYVVRVKNEKESSDVQKKLFKAGFVWVSGGTEVTCEHEKHIYINESGKGKLSCGSSWAALCSTSRRLGLILLEPEEIITDPHSLDGAKPPEKMLTVNGKEWSESTIIAALRQYVGE